MKLKLRLRLRLRLRPRLRLRVKSSLITVAFGSNPTKRLLVQPEM